QVVTANTTHCNQRVFASLDIDVAGPQWLVQGAVGVAMAARNSCASGRKMAAVAGAMASLAPPGRPDLVPADDELRESHTWLARELVNAGVDLVRVESMSTLREARIALDAVLAAGGAAWVSFACGGEGELLSGESLGEAARAIEAAGARAVLVNGSDLDETEASLRVLADVGVGRFGAAPGARSSTVADPEAFAQRLHGWVHDFGVEMLGGDLGYGPAHIGAMAAEAGSVPA
ncbi:MAG: homocysteine S-methyltransferase family protein, partial [Pseudomonadota bacterium]